MLKSTLSTSKILLCIFVLAIFYASYSQKYTLSNHKSIDSLEAILKTKNLTKEELIVNTFMLGQLNLAEQNLDKAFYLFDKTFELSKVILDTFGIANSQMGKSEYFLFKDETPKAIENAAKALNLFKAINNNPKNRSNQIIKCYGLLIEAYENTNNYGKAIDAALTSLNYLPKKMDTVAYRRKIDILNKLAYINGEIENYTNAVEYLKEALIIENKIDDEYGKAESYNNFAIIYSRQNQNQKALEYYELAHEIEDKIGNDFGKAAVINNIGISYFQLKEYDKSEKYLLEAIQLSKSLNHNQVLAESYMYLGKVYIKKDQNNKGLININKSIDIAKKINNNKIYIENLIIKAHDAKQSNHTRKAIQLLETSLLKSREVDLPLIEKKIHHELYNLYNSVDKTQSTYHYNKFKTLNDSIISFRNLNKTEVLKAEFNYLKIQSDLEKKEKDLALLKAQEHAAKTRNYFIIAFSSLITIFLVITILRQRKLNRTRKRMWETKRDLMVLKEEQNKKEIEFKNKQITDFAIYISEKNDLLEDIKRKIKSLKFTDDKIKSQIHKVVLFINDDINQNKEKVQLYSEIDETKDAFNHKISSLYPNLSNKEKQIATLVRLNQTSKQIGLQLNITSASVDNYRSMLRKKMNIPKGMSLVKFIKNI